MSFSKAYKDVMAVADGDYQKVFATIADDATKIAVYQKLLFKAGEGDATAKAALDDLHKDDDTFIKAQSDGFQAGIAIEQQRNAVAKANAIYQDYLDQKALEKADTEESTLFDPQGRLVYQLTLTEKEQEAVLTKIEAAQWKVVGDERDNEAVKKELQKLLGGRKPTNTTLCSIDLTGVAPTGDSKDAFKRIKDQYETKYPQGKSIPPHKRASIVASFEETYAHMCLMAMTYERIAKDWLYTN
ncbi:MAG: hypothetical protein ACRCXC_05465 [Legionella sp.]